MTTERTSSPEHWNMIYGKYRREELGWYAPVLTTSLEWVLKHADGRDAGLVDIGGGSSTLVDELIARNFTSLTIVDISEAAIAEAKQRLAAQAGGAQFLCNDIRDPDLNLSPVQVWHDRAAFHFLQDGPEIESYLKHIESTLITGGIVILGVFSENAPPRCSGLLVNRYTLPKLKDVFSKGFELLDTKTEVHITPGKVEQEYIYTAWRKR